MIIADRTICRDFLDRGELPITFETLLEPLKTTDRAIGLVLELRLELGNPDHICDCANEGDEWDQPPDQGRERSRFGGSKNDPESHHGCGEHAVRLCDGSRTFASINFSCSSLPCLSLFSRHSHFTGSQSAMPSTHGILSTPWGLKPETVDRPRFSRRESDGE